MWLTFARTKCLRGQSVANENRKVPARAFQVPFSQLHPNHQRARFETMRKHCNVGTFGFRLATVQQNCVCACAMLPRSLAAELKNSPARNKHHSKLFCLGWGAQQKELRNADTDRFLRRDCRPVDGIASPVAKSECSVLS